MISLVSMIASATATGTLLNLCAKKERQASRKPTKSSKSSKSSRASSTKSHRSSSKSGAGKSSKSHRGKSSKSGKGGKKSSKVGLIPGASGRKTEDKKLRSEKSSKKSKRSKRSKKSKKCKAMQCEPNMLKEKKKASTLSDASSKSSCSGREVKRGSGSLSSEKSGEKLLKAVPNSSNYKFPEGQIKPSTLKPSPNKLPFAPTGGVQTVTITNSTKARKAFKVKTSDNLLYRVNPVFGFVEPGEKMSIDVLRHNGKEKTDHLVLLTSNVTSEANCAKGVFESDPPRELTVVPLVAH